MSSAHATDARTSGQDSSTLRLERLEQFHGQREWEQQYNAQLAKAAQQRERRAASKSKFGQTPFCEPVLVPTTVGELAAKIKALGLPGDPHPARVTRSGALEKPSNWTKQRDALRRRKRLQFLKELECLPDDAPVPISLESKAHELLTHRRKNAATGTEDALGSVAVDPVAPPMLTGSTLSDLLASRRQRGVA